MNTTEYRKSQCGKLNTEESEYSPSIQIVDAHGNKTNYLGITLDEMKQIIEVLTK